MGSNNPWFAPAGPSTNSNTNTPAASPAPGASELAQALARIQQLERQVSILANALRVSTSGDIELQSSGGIRLVAARQLQLEGGQQGVTLRDQAGNSLALAMSGITVNAARVQVNAGTLQVNSGMSGFSGTVRCDTIIARTVVGSSYTPGAGNIW